MIGNKLAYNMVNKGIFVFVLTVLFSVYGVKVNIVEEGVNLSGKYKGYNVILIILDALRPDHLSCYGYPKKTSPNIDTLAKQGILFTNAFSQASYTLPSVTSIFTSVYPYSHRVLHIFKDNVPDKIDTLAQIVNEKIFKDALKNSDYNEYFGDMFGGDFGHCTPKGNKLLAENIANVILKECFNKRSLQK